MAERDYLFDNIKGYLIISVLTAHFFRVSGYFMVGTPSRVIYIISFSYIMQSFFFVSGYFSQNVDKCRRTAFKQFLIPYVIFVYLTYFERCILYGQDHCHVHMFEPTFALWFLLLMFLYRLFIKDLAKVPYILPICFALYLAAAFIPFLGEGLAAARIASFLVFYMLGYYFKPEYVQKIRQIPRIFGVLTLAVLLASCIIYGQFKFPHPEVLLMRAPVAEYGLGLVGGLACRLAIFAGAMLWMGVFLNLMPRRNLWLTTLGQRTMTVYLLHIFVRNLIKYYHIPHPGSPSYYAIIIGLVIACLFCFSRPFVVKGYDKMIDGIYWVITAPLRLIQKGKNS